MKPLSLFEKILKITMPCALITAGYFGAQYFINSKQKVKPKPKQEIEQVVSVRESRRADEKVVIEAMGTVKAQRELDLKPQVSGRVVWLNPAFLKGAHLKAGDELIHIEKVDYEVVVQQTEAEILGIQADLDLELGKQEVAKRELELLGKRQLSALEKKLTLRQPQLMQLQAQLKSTQLKLKKAKLDLERCVVKVPFNCVVDNRVIELGGQVNANNALGKLISTDLFWVSLEVPVDRLGHIQFPRTEEDMGSAVKVFYGSAQKPQVIEGEVRYLMNSLQSKGRMAEVLVAIKDPLGLEVKRQPLLADSFVKAHIDGGFIPNVVRLKRSSLRDSQFVWKAKKDSAGVMRLAIEPIDIVWQDGGAVFVQSGLEDGEGLIVSDIATPVKGMRLRVEGPIKKKEEIKSASKKKSLKTQGV